MGNFLPWAVVLPPQLGKKILQRALLNIISLKDTHLSKCLIARLLSKEALTLTLQHCCKSFRIRALKRTIEIIYTALWTTVLLL